jgi:hypothetical protein
MAFRIHDSVLRGEVDNRTKGIVRGRVWLDGKSEPLELNLNGNACPDLAGCLLKFVNPGKTFVDKNTDAIATNQRGQIGDLTASRKVRVWDVPFEEGYAMCKRGEKPPEHMANCLYLEWFSQANGRVVIESADYQLEISAPEWRMTDEENRQRTKEAGEGMGEFMGRLTAAVEKHKRGQKSPEEEWDEFDYEKFLKESDARNEKYGELLDKYGHSDEAHEKIDREMGWTTDETAETKTDADADANADKFNIEEIDFDIEEPVPDPSREGIDWIRDQDGDIVHPLQHRCSESGRRFLMKAQELGMEKTSDPDLDDFIFEFLGTGAKLAGALNPYARDAVFMDAAFTVAYLKRALDRLHKAQRGLEGLAPKNILPPELISEARKELFEIREGILKLMDQLRGRE